MDIEYVLHLYFISLIVAVQSFITFCSTSVTHEVFGVSCNL